MLHMVVNTHSPQDCPFRGDDEAKAMVDAIEAFTSTSVANGLDIQGSWASRGAHEIFLLVQATDAHAIDDALLRCGLTARTHSRVLPVVTVAQMLEAVRPFS